MTLLCRNGKLSCATAMLKIANKVSANTITCITLRKTSVPVPGSISLIRRSYAQNMQSTACAMYITNNVQTIGMSSLYKLPIAVQNRFIITNNVNYKSTEQTSESDVKQRVILGQVVDANPVLSAGDQDKKTKEDKQKSSKALWWTKFSLAAFSAMLVGCSGYLVLIWGPPNRDEYGDVIKDEFSDRPVIIGNILRAVKKINIEIEDTQAPSREKLLPEPLQEPYYQPAYTLVIEMTDVLVHPEYDWHMGWRFKKRAGVDYFLQQVGPPLFEIVIYTSEGGQTAWPVLDSLDPNGFIMYRLFRDATRYKKGKHYKDLDSLNRDLSKVIAVDWSADALSLNRENALIIKRWQGESDELQLIQLAAFLRTIATSGIDDVRPVLKHYSTAPDPIEAFAINQKKLQEEEALRLAEALKSDEDKRVGGLVSSWKGGLFGRHRQ